MQRGNRLTVGVWNGLPVLDGLEPGASARDTDVLVEQGAAADLPLNFHPAAVRVSANVTPFGAVSVPA